MSDETCYDKDAKKHNSLGYNLCIHSAQIAVNWKKKTCILSDYAVSNDQTDWTFKNTLFYWQIIDKLVSIINEYIQCVFCNSTASILYK